MMNLVQGDCKCGALAFVAGENLSAATGLLVRLSSAGKAVKPGAVSDIAPYVVACGAFEGYLCGVVPLTSAANCRLVLKGVCQAGALLVSAGDGRVEAGTLSGPAVPVGVAEEAGVDGQRVLLRPLSVGAKGADGAVGVAGPAGVQGPAGAAGSDGAPGTEFLLDPASVINLQPNQVGALIGLEGGSWNGAVPGMGAELSALVTGTLTAGENTWLVCSLLFEVGAGSFVVSQVPVSMIGTPVDPLAVGGLVSAVDDGSGLARCVLVTGYNVSVFNYNMLKCVAIANGVATLRHHYNP